MDKLLKEIEDRIVDLPVTRDAINEEIERLDSQVQKLRASFDALSNPSYEQASTIVRIEERMNQLKSAIEDNEEITFSTQHDENTKNFYGCFVPKEASFTKDFLPKIREEGLRVSFGALEEPTDSRDYTVDMIEEKLGAPVIHKAEVSSKIDYSDGMLPIEDQGYEGTCVGFAVAAMKEWQERKEREYWARFDPKAIKNISERWIYFKAREPYGWDNVTDQGAYIRDAFKVLAKQGAIIESGWPYVAQDWVSKPNARRVADAMRYTIKEYVSLPASDITLMEKGLAAAGPFVIGVSVFDGFFKPQNGLIPNPPSRAYNYGGHAICVVGRDKNGFGVSNQPLWKIRNSWSAAWGANGYGYLTDEYIRRYSGDNWGSVDYLTTKQFSK